MTKQGLAPLKYMTKFLIAVFLSTVATFGKDVEMNYNALVRHQRLGFMELCTPADSTLAKDVLCRGGTVQRFGLHNGCDLAKPAGFLLVKDFVTKHRPRHT